MIRKLNNEEIDITIIELRTDEDKLNEQEFMEIDDELKNDNISIVYILKDIYII